MLIFQLLSNLFPYLCPSGSTSLELAGLQVAEVEQQLRSLMAEGKVDKARAQAPGWFNWPWTRGLHPTRVPFW